MNPPSTLYYLISLIMCRQKTIFKISQNKSIYRTDGDYLQLQKASIISYHIIFILLYVEKKSKGTSNIHFRTTQDKTRQQ